MVVPAGVPAVAAQKRALALLRLLLRLARPEATARLPTRRRTAARVRRLLRPLPRVRLQRPPPATSILQRPFCPRVRLQRPPPAPTCRDFAAAVDVVRAALVTPSTVRAIILGGRSDASQQVLANAAAVEVAAQGLDRMAADEQERAERALSVAEHRPRQPPQPPPPPRSVVGAQLPGAAAIAPKATAIGPTAAAATAPAPRPAPRTPTQPPKAKPWVPPLAASATPQWPSNSWSGWGSGQTGSEEGTAASSSAGWRSSSQWTSASTPFTAKSPNAISDSRS